ncbi:EamA-like transporter family protein [Kibdelosporangium aridum]|uniref:EamA-like transporter family protein n=2 Tax=Kibdelosporangium aridum TaxID=2030 RepID=A0A1W1ZTA4_KIBAR|nr:EamA-like transporter family protein [Kibdelosporangium aridum]
MLMILLSVAGACAYGVADFLGGLASRKAHVLRVVVISAPASLAIELVLWPVLGAAWNAGSLGWGALSGVASAFAFSLLYLALSIGPMSIMAPITAIVSALLPAVVGLVGGERLSVAGLIGIPVAVGAIVLVTVSRTSAAVSLKAIIVAVLAGAAIAVQLITLDAAPHDSGVAPLIVGRTVSSLLVFSVVLFVRTSDKGKVPVVVAAAAGCLDSLANLLFLLAAREGMLSISAVIVALYPAATVVLAAVVLKERIRRSQWLGLAAAATGVILLASS